MQFPTLTAVAALQAAMQVRAGFGHQTGASLSSSTYAKGNFKSGLYLDCLRTYGKPANPKDPWEGAVCQGLGWFIGNDHGFSEGRDACYNYCYRTIHDALQDGDTQATCDYWGESKKKHCWMGVNDPESGITSSRRA